MEEIKMFCFPFAGGHKYSYNSYSKYAPPQLKIISTELPGRGARINEPLLTNLESIVLDIYRQIEKDIKGNYCFYGHSMGTLIGYLLARKISEENTKPLPKHLFVTGRGGPSTAKSNGKTHRLPKEEFFNEVKLLGGLPQEILDNHELMDFFGPILRADFKAINGYRYEATKALDIPISILTGTNENIHKDDIGSWQNESSYKIDARQLPGTHFFIFEHDYFVMRWICKKLAIV